MKKTLMWVLIGVAAVVVVVLVSAVIIISLYDYNSLKPKISTAVKNATGREMVMAGDIGLAIGFTPALVLNDIRLQNADWGSEPDMVRINRFEVQVGLLPLIKRRIQIKRFILSDADILIETDKTGRSNLAFKPPPEAEPEKAPAAAKPESEAASKGLELPAVIVNHVEIRNSRLRYHDGKSQKTNTLALDSLLIKTEGYDRPLEISLESRFNDAPVSVAGSLGSIEALLSPGKPWPLKTNLAAFGAEIALEGQITDVTGPKGIDLAFGVELKDPAQLTPLIQTELPAVSPLKVSGRLTDTGPKAYRISDLNTIAGVNTIKGFAQIDLAGQRPALTADLDGGKLDLQPFFKKQTATQTKPDAAQSPPPSTSAAKTAPTPAKQKRAKVFPDDPLPLEGLKAVDADFKFKAAQMILPQAAMDQLALAARLQNGHLQIQPLKAVLGGGSLDADVDLTPQDQKAALTAKLKIDGLGLGAMLQQTAVAKEIDGNLDADIDIKGKGASVAKLMAGLNGHVSLIMDNGRIHNKYINLAGADLASGIFRLLNPASTKSEYTTVNCFVTRFDIKNGLAQSSALVFDTDLMSLAGEGQIDLGSEALDLSLNPQPKKSLGAKGVGIGLSLGELAKPLKLAGTLAEPALVIDKKKAAEALGKTIGGILAFGPAGIAGAMASGQVTDENPCLAAIAIAKGASPPAKPAPQQPAAGSQSQSQPQQKGPAALPDVGKTLKGLFGN